MHHARRNASRRPAPGRPALGLALAALTLPVMVLAHLLTAGAAPGALPVLLAGALLVVLVTALDTGPEAADGARRTRLLVAVLAAQAGGHALFSLTGPGSGCLPVVGRGAAAGVRLALLQPVVECPPGTLALTGLGTTTLSLLVAATLVLLVHALTGTAGTSAVLAIEAGLGTALHVLRALQRRQEWPGAALTRLLVRVLTGPPARLARLLADPAQGRTAPAGPHGSPVADSAGGPAARIWAGRTGVRRGPPLPAT